MKYEFPYDPAIPLLGIRPEKTIIQKDTCTPVFVAALFTVAKTRKQPKGPWTEERIKKMWYTYIMEYYSAIGDGDGTPLWYSCLKHPMGGGAWWAAVRGVAEGRTRLSDFTVTFHFHALEKDMATHSSVLAWRIPGTGDSPGGLSSMGSHRVGYD